ncbi:MAG: NCS2 family permease [Spirochaetales bacterium]|nr:NCS2 family permease [Spirochaetales bacterium]
MKLIKVSFKEAALKKAGTDLKTEIMAGVTTFLAMAYILAVNPGILSASGMDAGAVFTATALSSAIATLVMGLVANLPFALAPGMGLNAFLAYTVCLTMGYSWQFALTAIFCEGIIFLLLTAFNVREAIVNSIPANLKRAIGVGIGLFIAFIGLQNAGIIVDNSATLVGLNITSNTAIVALIGLIITAILTAYNVKGGILIGILVTTIIGIPFGVTQFSGFASMPPSIAPTFCKFNFSEVFAHFPDFLIVMFTFLFVDMFDTVGTLIGCAGKADMINADGSIPNCKEALFADAVGTTVGAMLGTSTVTTFVESSTGVVEGGRTGVTAIVTAGLFLLSLFLSPLFLSIPSAATAPALILVGFFMMSPVKDIDFKDPTEGVPAFLCILMMVCAYSISDGIMFGILSYVIIKACAGKAKKISIPTYIVALLFVVKIIINIL